MKETQVLQWKMTRRQGLAHCTVLVALGAAALATPLPFARAAAAKAQKILVVGDSLSAEYGLQRGSGWVALLEQRLADEGIAAAVVNASISGDTTSGGRTRLPSLLRQHRPDIVVIELGANDALRGLPLEETRANLAAMTQAAKEAGARVLLVGMQIPPNYGRAYGEAFANVFGTVARSEDVALVPFLLKGVADVPQAERMFQPDRIHPLATAHPRMLDNVWPGLEPLLRRKSAAPGGPS
jgi:acyl-CoA thioesterase I